MGSTCTRQASWGMGHYEVCEGWCLAPLNHAQCRGMQAKLDTMVTVVDASSFPALYGARGPLASRPDLGDGGGLRPVVDLLVEQLECVATIQLSD